MPIAAQFGVAEESTYGTAVTVSRFFEFVDENLQPNLGRIQNKGKRAGQRQARAATPVQIDGAGPVGMLVGTKGHGLLLKHSLGSVATTGPTDSAYTHVFTPGSLIGKYLTTQVGRELVGTTTLQPFTFAGCKIAAAEWKIARGDDGFLSANYTLDTKFPVTATALASPSYTTSVEQFPWTNAALTISGTNVEFDEATITLTTPMKTDRLFVGNTKKEPLENGQIDVAFSIGCEFTSLTHYNLVTAAAKSSTIAPVILTCTGLDLIGTSTYPSIKFELTAAQFNEIPGLNVSGDDPIKVTLSGKGTWDLTNPALKITYVSADATP